MNNNVDDFTDGKLSGLSSSGVLLNNPILAYLKLHNYDEKAPFGIHKRAMEKFISSCAGFCVMSYLLDIGDRHLDNILIKQSGELFHVDFSFVFGRDPKPFKSKMRFTQEMVAAMGGVHSPLFQYFLDLCGRTYNILRRCSSIVMSQLRMMTQSTITDFTMKQKPLDVMNNTLELFELQLSDEEATKHIQTIVHDSLVAVMPTVLERMHRIANAFR
jgi:phosphatidylinositol 3-kinase